MDQEMEAPIDDLEAMFETEDEELFGYAAPTNNCTEIGPGCS